VKRITLAAAALSIAVIVGGCSSINPDAASVNGSAVKRFDFERDLQAIEEAFAAANKAASTAGTASGPPPTLALATPRADAAALLTIELEAQVVHDEMVRRKLTPSTLPADDASLLEASRGGLADQVFTQLPKSMQSRWIQGGRERLALQKAETGNTAIDEGTIKARYDQDPGSYLEICFSAIVLKDTTDLATAQSQLAAGKSFGDVAAALSIDPSAANNGAIKSGTEPCWLASDLQTQSSQIYSILAALPVGKPSDPIQTTTGQLLLQTDKVAPAALARVHDAIAATLQQEQTQVVPKLLTQLLSSATVKVDPRYGDWDPTTTAVVASKTLDQAVPAGTATTVVPTPTTTG